MNTILLKSKLIRSKKMEEIGINKNAIPFHKDEYVVFLKMDSGEIYDHFIERGLFVASQKPKTDKEYEEALLYSKIYMSSKIYGCVYQKNVMDRLKEMEENMKQS